jgi:nicotinamidase-related amidase
MLRPRPDDYFMFKPKHSGFFATPLAALLRHLGTRQLIVTGVTAEQCVLFTAIDAYLRDFQLVVPGDCIAGLRQVRCAREHLRTILKARMAASPSIRFDRRSTSRALKRA